MAVEREGQQHETGLAAGAAALAVEYLVQHASDFDHLLVVLSLDRRVAQAVLRLQRLKMDSPGLALLASLLSLPHKAYLFSCSACGTGRRRLGIRSCRSACR